MDTPIPDAPETVERFIERSIETEVVWALEGEESVAYAESNAQEGVAVLLFWSDRADAKRARKTRFKEYELVEIPLLEFIFRWLSGMADDEVLAGLNWSGRPEELEADPEQLQDDLLLAMDETMRAKYYDALQDALDPADPVEGAS